MSFDPTKYKVWTWKSPIVLHWIINPFLAVNEFFFGQRVARISLIEKDSSQSLSERIFIPCPHCGTIHPGLKWSAENKTAFGNWFGLYCDQCGNVIPCVRNLMSYVLIGLTFPIWILFIKSWRKNWITKQQIKFSKPFFLNSPKFIWYKGLIWGAIMYVFNTILFPLFDGEEINGMRLLIGVPIYFLAGILFGLTVQAVDVKPRNSKSQENIA
jgi:hypothetical protein